MHTYKKLGEELWYVMFRATDTNEFGTFYEWNKIREFTTEGEAAAYVNYLNGGSGKSFGAEQRS